MRSKSQTMEGSGLAENCLRHYGHMRQRITRVGESDSRLAERHHVRPCGGLAHPRGEAPTIYPPEDESTQGRMVVSSVERFGLGRPEPEGPDQGKMVPPLNYPSCKSHCCELHGCKYGHAGCPVVNREVKQDYPCEFCPDVEDVEDAVKVMREAAWLFSRGFTTTTDLVLQSFHELESLIRYERE